MTIDKPMLEAIIKDVVGLDDQLVGENLYKTIETIVLAYIDNIEIDNQGTL